MSAAEEEVTSDSSDGDPRKASTRHWLLDRKLALEDKSTRDRTASERKGERLGRQDRSCKNSIIVGMST